MRDLEFGAAHNSTGSVVIFKYLIPWPKALTKQKPGETIGGVYFIFH